MKHKKLFIQLFLFAFVALYAVGCSYEVEYTPVGVHGDPYISATEVPVWGKVLIENVSQEAEYEIKVDGNFNLMLIDSLYYIESTAMGEGSVTLVADNGKITVIDLTSWGVMLDDYDTDYQGLIYNPLSSEVSDNRSIVAQDLMIPRYVVYNGVKVNITKISPNAFYKNANIKKIELADQSMLKQIQQSAFFECSNLEDFDMSNSSTIELIDDSAYYKCSALVSFNFADTTDLKFIGEASFSSCSSLSAFDFTAMPSLKSVDIKAFEKCNSLLVADFSNCPALQTLGWRIFSNAANLKSVDFSNCTLITLVDGWSFDGCSSLESVNLLGCSSLSEIEEKAFQDCSSLQSIVVSSDGVSFGSNVFSGVNSACTLYCTLGSTTENSALTELCPHTADINTWVQ